MAKPRVAQVLLASGLVGAVAAAAVVSGVFSSKPGDSLFSGLPSTSVVAAGAGAVDYNCDRPGMGYPWLEYLPGDLPDGLAGDAWPVQMAVKPGVFRSTVGLDYRVGLPLEGGPGGVLDPAGAVDYAKVYESLCRVHPDLGGTGLRPLTPDQRGMLYDFGVTIGRGSPGGEPTECLCRVHPDVVAGEEGVRCIPTDIPGFEICPDTWQSFLPDPRSGCEYLRIAFLCHEVFASEGWEHFYTDAPAPYDAQPMRLYWLPPIPSDLRDQLSRETGDEATREGEDEDQVTRQRWRILLSGFEVDEGRGPFAPFWLRIHHRLAALRFDYQMEAEFTLRRAEDEWVFDSGVLVESLLSVSAQYQPESAWLVNPPGFLDDPQALDQPGRALQGRVHGDEVRLEWGTFGPWAEVEVMLFPPCPPETCEKWFTVRHQSVWFLNLASSRWVPLEDGFTRSWEEQRGANLWDAQQELTYTISLRQLDSN